MSDFDNNEITKVIPNDVQETLLSSDTDPAFVQSEFWFKFQHMEKELSSLREGYLIIYKIMKMRWDRVDDVPNEYLKIIFQLVTDVIEGSQTQEGEITITT